MTTSWIKTKEDQHTCNSTQHKHRTKKLTLGFRSKHCN